VRPEDGATTGDPPREIERKYLLDGLPPEAGSAPHVTMDQGYLPGERIIERLRRVREPTGERYLRTIKLGSGVSRIEIEEPVARELFIYLWPLTEGRRISKTRHLIPAGDLTWEVDEFRDRSLVLAEVELQRVEQPPIPQWLAARLVREVTDDPAYSNYRLAR